MNTQLIFPVVGPITQRFGENPEDYVRFGFPGHNGVDFGVTTGTPVGAAAAGTVALIGWEAGGYGNYVKIDHGGGWITYYAHLLKANPCRPGQQVQAGDEIGLSNNSGNSTGPHLHFGLKIAGQNPAYKGYVDPLPYLTGGAPAPVTADETGAIDLGGMAFKVIVERLNVRSGPGTGFPIIGSLTGAQVVKGVRLHCNDAWVEIGDGRFVALVYAGVEYLEPVKP